MGYYLFNFSKKGATRSKTLREQAAELLDVKMWGIGAKTPNRLSLAPGDCVLVYVGAPERAFIGHAELESRTHEWTPDEAARYPGSFEGGVLFSHAEIWSHPLPMKTVLPELALKETNPGAHFFSGVVRISKEDYERIGSLGTGTIPLAEPPERATPDAAEEEPPTQAREDGAGPSAPEHGDRPIDVSLLFRTVEKLRTAGKVAASLSEYDTRAEFIDRYLEALGYTEFGDIQRGSPVESGNFPDYVLRVNAKAAIAIEAKKLGAPLAGKEAAQVIAYCSNLGARWGGVTDGRYFKLYDAPVLGVPPEERQVLSIDLADYKNRDDFEARICPDLELIAKRELESGAGLERRVALEAVRELLTATTSKALKSLRRELDERKNIKLSADEVSELVSDILG
jgi:predicted type IV restriction endonuclease